MEIRWQIQFMSFLGTGYVLSIFDADYTGRTVTQLTGAAKPFVTSEDDSDDFYTPIRTQSGYIRFIAENTSIVGQMMPTKATDRPVVLRTLATGVVCWVGFLSQEQYSQPWAPCPYEVEIPVVSVMMAMRGMEFTQAEGYTSLLSLLKTIDGYLPMTLKAVISEASPIGSVFVQNNNFREFLTIAERADRSTSNKYDCETIYDCVEHFCNYFGVSLREYVGVFFFTVADNNSVRYEEMSLNGNTQEAQWGSVSLSYLTICGADNQQDFSPAYRRVTGSFETGKDKAENIYEQGDFLKQFSVRGGYPTAAPANLLFNGNSEVLPYKNGTQQTSWILEATTEYGGQIIRHRDTGLNVVTKDGSSWGDYFYIYSRKASVGSPSRAMVFNVPQKVYINSGEYSALNISCRVSAWYDATQGGDFIKRLHMKIRVGNYWLKSEIPSTSTLTRYTWTTTESSCWLLIDGGSVTMKGAMYTLDFRAEAMMDNASGLAIDMPSGLSAGYYDVYMELLCNAEDKKDFGDYANIGYLVSGLTLKILRGTNSVSQPTPDFGSNNIIAVASNTRGGDYTVDSSITTRQGVQYGAGCALDSSHAYITTRYDKQGISRRAAFVGHSREVLTIDVRKHTQPIESVDNSGKYAILSQNIDWRDDVNTIKIIKI